MTVASARRNRRTITAISRAGSPTARDFARDGGDLASRLPELPAKRRARLAREYGIGESEAAILTAERDIADFYESVATSDSSDRARLAANWIVNDLTGLQRARGLPPTACH